MVLLWVCFFQTVAIGWVFGAERYVHILIRNRKFISVLGFVTVLSKWPVTNQTSSGSSAGNSLPQLLCWQFSSFTAFPILLWHTAMIILTPIGQKLWVYACLLPLWFGFRATQFTIYLLSQAPLWRYVGTIPLRSGVLTILSHRIYDRVWVLIWHWGKRQRWKSAYKSYEGLIQVLRNHIIYALI